MFQAEIFGKHYQLERETQIQHYLYSLPFTPIPEWSINDGYLIMQKMFITCNIVYSLECFPHY